jgi:Viral BACON domain
MIIKRVFVIILISILTFGLLISEEIPKPTYDNSIMFSWTHTFLSESVAETDYIKSQFGNGLYAPLMFSSFYGLRMDWYVNPADSSSNISAFKSKVDEMISFAKQHNVGIHITLLYGLSRKVTYYNEAKIEDIRNAQWYNDNNISSSSQQRQASDSSNWDESLLTFRNMNLDHTATDGISVPYASSSIINNYVFSTFSRYARKLRAHLNGKVAATFAYLTQVQNANPDVTIIISAPGESELNSLRIDQSSTIQTYFCDYSPFAVLEFRDWLQHSGLYASGQLYDGDGYSGGGSKYQGSGGLSKFNSDFGTSFSSWNLKYYNWSLSDTVDTNYVDSSNPDPKVIPVSQYSYNGMKPASGSNYISGGFDPPRTMVDPGTNSFYDLWTEFRQRLVYHYVKDMTDIARSSGFTKDHYYTHQIPGDYLFGTRPNDPNIPNLNPRYYSSSSPMWTAGNYSDVGAGITLYDIKFPTWFARTSTYGISAASALNNNWAALEYHPEVIPIGISSTISDIATIYDQMIRLYNGSPHVISFFKWKDTTDATSEYRYKGNNREYAAKQFFDAIKDKARGSLTNVFTPKEVVDFEASYSSGLVYLNWSSKIWSDASYTWNQWGDFKEFAIYRGYSADFTANSASKIAGISENTYKDATMNYGTTVYYKIFAVNKNGEVGTLQTDSVVTPEGVPIPIMSVSLQRMNFGHIKGDANPQTQDYRIANVGAGALNWTAVSDMAWLSSTPSSGTNGAVVTVSVDPTGMNVGSYIGNITISDPLATDSPKSISVYLTIINSSQSAAPFGSFDTPGDNTTVRSSIPVTGWVLDDIGVESVKLYRDPVSGEGNSLIYIGDAGFVEGARPDVELAYPDYPANYKAGWGYMMLTNFLPGGGNGTFKIHAIVKDTSGKQVTLGTKTITIDNAGAVKPFGAIDTPGQGGNASGSTFVNWGWVLTPQPNSIPTDGSTIEVIVSGKVLGNPHYNNYRSDIANLFPTYANSNGAVGYFTLDTTSLVDGVHTIQWLAKDSSFNKDGIGSRYFTVSNSGSDAQQSRASQQNIIHSKRPTQSLPPFNYETLKTFPYAKNEIIKVKKGYDANSKAETMVTDNNGILHIEIRELERIVIRPGNDDSQSHDVTWTACQLVGDQIRSLPIGSTFENDTGTLYWQPGHTFFGDYTILFVSGSSIANHMKPKRVIVKIKIKEKFNNK